MTGGRSPAVDAKPQPAWPGTLALGLGLVLVSEALLFVDLSLRGWAVVPAEALAPPRGAWHSLGRWVAVDMTPLCWLGVLFTLDGLLTLRARRRPGRGVSGGSPARTRPRRFGICFLASVPIWLIFEWFNLAFLDAWRYHGLPENVVHLYTGYFVAFGAICPAMFLLAELYQRLGLRRLRGRPLSLGPRVQVILLGLGLVMLGFPMVVRDPLGTLTLWLAWIFVFDPINHRLGAPSLIGDWRAGRPGRTLALMAGGATCAFLWEFWNYWAAAKWTYHLPFLGAFEEVRYFEMPLPGLLGFAPFALECWVLFQTVVLALDRLGLRLAEPLPDADSIL